MSKLAVKIRGKSLWELYSPAGANKNGHADRDEFEKIVGNADFHSFQVWRTGSKGVATCTYAMTLEQIEALRKAGNRQIAGLKGRITVLMRENAKFCDLQEDLERLAANNEELHIALFNAKSEVDKSAELTRALQHNVDTLAERVPEERMTRSHASATGKSPAQLVVEARTSTVNGIVSIPTNGQPDQHRFQIGGR